jgi:hypothetical protein
MANPATSSTLSIPQTAPVGIITITQPPQTATSFYKIAPSQLITFAWNFSMVLATPTSLTVSAICDNGNTYPVGPTNGIIPGTATSVVWDVYSYQQNYLNTPLAQASYTLTIWDDRGPNPTRAPGYLQPNNGLQFALYTPQAYTPLASGNNIFYLAWTLLMYLPSGWQCNICSGAFSSFPTNPALVGIFTTILVMFLSGFSLLRLAPRMR